jgi:hypothetical protein
MPETQLIWNGAGAQLSDWSVKSTPSGPIDQIHASPNGVLTEEKLERVIAKHLGA